MAKATTTEGEAVSDETAKTVEDLVAEKVAAGLPHDTATEVVKRQLEWDAEQAAETKNKVRK